MKRRFKDLSPAEVLALAVSLEEEDARLYQEFARRLRPHFPQVAATLDALQGEEHEHRRRLIETYREKFGEELPLIGRQDVRGFVHRGPLPKLRPLGIEQIRRRVALMELETERFYNRAAAATTDARLRQLFGDLAAIERTHEQVAAELDPSRQREEDRDAERNASRRLFVLQVVQPGLAGLMDGSVSTLAPLFAAAFATEKSWPTFLVGLAAAVGAGISMAFAEALSDDGSLTGRGKPVLRGVVCGAMTFAGGVGHAIPYLIPNFATATVCAMIVVVCELITIAWIRNRYMDTPFLSAAFQVIVGGVIVFLAGILIGNA